VPLDSLTLDKDNLKKHDQYNIDTVAGSLKEYGQVEPLVVRPDGTLIGGEGRILAIRQDPELRWTHVARVTFRGGEKAAQRLGILLNRSAELGEWDKENLAAFFERAVAEEDDLMSLGWRPDDVEDFMAGLGRIAETEEEEFRGGYAESPEETAARSAGAPPQADPIRQAILVFPDADQYTTFQRHVGVLRNTYGLEGGGITPIVCEAVRRAAEGE
jgi:hypothetical protein